MLALVSMVYSMPDGRVDRVGRYQPEGVENRGNLGRSCHEEEPS
jgi:hypothetical protein